MPADDKTDRARVLVREWLGCHGETGCTALPVIDAEMREAWPELGEELCQEALALAVGACLVVAREAEVSPWEGVRLVLQSLY